MKKYAHFVKSLLIVLAILGFSLLSLSRTVIMIPEIIVLRIDESSDLTSESSEQFIATRMFGDKRSSKQDTNSTGTGDPVALEANRSSADENTLVTAVGAGHERKSPSTGEEDVSAEQAVGAGIEAVNVIAPESLNLIVNTDSEQLPLGAAAEPADATGVKLIYETSDESVATVDENGTVTGIGSGTCMIFSSLVSADGTERLAAAETAVTVQIAPESISLKDSSVHVGSASTIYPQFTPEKVDLGDTFTWESSNPDIVNINNTGTFSGVSKGTATITATNELGQTASCSITIKPILCDYCGSQNHMSYRCANKSVSNGAIGRWIIPDVGVDVACYASDSQSVCDAQDSACYFAEGVQKLIADHDSQGFQGIKYCSVGTLAYMDQGNGSRKAYVCTDVFSGHNNGQITDAAGNPVSEMNDGGIACYTCDGSSENVVVAFFQPK